jgi:hypothetical protein
MNDGAAYPMDDAFQRYNPTMKPRSALFDALE